MLQCEGGEGGGREEGVLEGEGVFNATVVHAVERLGLCAHAQELSWC